MGFIKRVKQAIPEFKEQAQIVSESYGGGKFRWTLSMAWCLIRYGARPIDYVRFEFHKKSARERNRYLTIYRYFRMGKHFGAGSKGVSGKISEYKTFADYIYRPWMVADKDTDSQVIKDFIAKQETVFAKPNMGDQGHGVMKIQSSDVQAINLLLSECKKSPYVVEGFIRQIDEIAKINPSSVNTVRVYSLLKRDGKTQILGIMLRVGKKGSHVDNWGSGGVGYNFDLETGVCVDYGRDKKNNPYIFHPDSNIKMVGYQLPDFQNLKQQVVEMSKKVPQARFVGWDIAITPDGYELVEMNCPGGHDFLQAFGEPYGDLLKRELK